MKRLGIPARDGALLDAIMCSPATANAPLVILAPGLGGTKDGVLEPFLRVFAAHGIAALAFDYRGFGRSTGTPRQWVEPRRHREDYVAAIDFARDVLARQHIIDPARIALWGSSFSGGNAIVLAAERRDIAALVVQCPFLRTPPALQPRGLALARFVLAATFDLMKIFGPVYVPLFGRPDEFAFAVSRENPRVRDFPVVPADAPGHAFWRALPQSDWENRMRAKMLASIDEFVPIDHVEKVTCPTLLLAGRNDDMVPLAYVEEAHMRTTASHKELAIYDGGHFDFYVGAQHEVAVVRQAEFLAQHLGAAPLRREINA